MAYINIPIKDNSTPLSPTEFNYLVDKLNARRLRDLIDVQDDDPAVENIIRHNGSGWVYYNIKDDHYTKDEINQIFGGVDVGGGGIPTISVNWGDIQGTIRNQSDLVANFGDLQAATNTWSGIHFADNYVINGSTSSSAVSGSMDNFFISDGLTDVSVTDANIITIEGSGVSFNPATKTFTISNGGVGIETDPIFTAWNKSTGISITESQISDLKPYLLSYIETDPVFTAWDKSTGVSITKSQISDWSDIIAGDAAIILVDEGNGFGYVAKNDDRLNKGAIGLNALDLSVSDGLGIFLTETGSMGESSLTMGSNNQNKGYSSFINGEECQSTDAAWSSFQVMTGYRNTSNAYATLTLGAFNANNGNYGMIGGVSNTASGGGCMIWGTALSNTGGDNLALFGTSNIRPTDSGGNIYHLLVGNGTTTGDGNVGYTRNVPSDSFRVYRTGRIEAPDFTLAKYVSGYDLTTVEKVSSMINKLAWLDTSAIGESSIEVDGKTFLHNFTGSDNAATNDWTTNTFLGVNAGNYTNGGTAYQGSLNVGIGAWALNSITTGQQNNMIGNEAGASITTGSYNNAIGDAALYYLTAGSNNISIGKNSFQNIVLANNNIGIGRNAGYYDAAGTQMTSGDTNLLIGDDSRIDLNGGTGQIVIGNSARGKGNHTAIIGSPSNTDVYLSGKTHSDGYSINSLNTAPVSSTDTGTLGEIRITADYIYVCTATDTWKRTAIATW